MSFFTPVRMIVIGGILVIGAVVLPFLMILDVLESTLFLNFVSYLIGLVGMFLGVAGTALNVKSNRRK